MDEHLYNRIMHLDKGSYIKVGWFDANDTCGVIGQLKKPEVLVDEWGVFLGVEGNPKHVLLGKLYVPDSRTWEISCIPLSLVDSVDVIGKETSREIRLKRYRVEGCRQLFIRKVKGLG